MITTPLWLIIVERWGCMLVWQHREPLMRGQTVCLTGRLTLQSFFQGSWRIGNLRISRSWCKRHWPFRTWGCIWRRLTVWERWMLKCQASFRATWAMRLTQVKYGVWMGHEEDRTCVECLWWTGNGMHCRALGQVKTLLGRVWSSSRAPHLEIQDHHLDDGTFTGSWAFISAWGKWTSFLIHNVR